MPGPVPSSLWFGGDYNPEQWPESVWREDMELMRRAGVTLATVGVFSWSLLEPREGEYDFAWLDRVLDLLDANGIRACLATPTASPPPWFTLAHPEAMPVNAEGVRLTHGSRDTYDVCAPAYRAASVRIARALADRYGEHPALALWHVHNEYGTPNHGEPAAAEFRTWLHRRHGSLEALNEAWTTAFWGQRYSAWEQIQPPRATQYLRNPAHVLDFRRFLSEAMLAHYRAQRDVLRAKAPHVPVTTNFAFGGWVPVDHWKWADDLDLVAIDHYPDDTGVSAAEQGAFAADLARSWSKDRRWLLMEQATGYIGPVTRPKAPDEIARHSVGHVARGSLGALFFQWRASRGGSEQWHSAMLPHAGPDSRVFSEVCELGSTLPRLAKARDAAVIEDAAVLWDPECWWALDAATLPAPDLDYAEAVRQVHRTLWRQGRTTAFTAPGTRPPDLPLLVVPMAYLISDDTARELTAYVERGGTLVVTYLSGIVDEHARVRTGGYPGALRELLGVRVEELHPLDGQSLDGDSVAVTSSDGTSLGRAHRWSEHVHLAGAEAVAHYVGGPLDGRPAVTRAFHGTGSAWYVSADLDDDALGVVLAAAAPPPGPVPPPGVEAIRRSTDGDDWVFVLNHGPVPYSVDTAALDLDSETLDEAFDVVTDTVAEGMSVPPGGYAVLRRAR